MGQSGRQSLCKQRRQTSCETPLAKGLKRRRALDELNHQQQTKKRLVAQAKEEERKVKAARQKLRILEDTAVMKKEMATFTPESLGYNVPNHQEKKYRERRHTVLDRLSKLGQGLSSAQKIDFPWFKEAWDKAMLDRYGSEWGVLFASQVQHILDDISAGKTNAFSLMVHSETQRELNLPALRL